MSVLDSQLPFILNTTISLTEIALIYTIITTYAVGSILHSLFRFWRGYRNIKEKKVTLELDNGKTIEISNVNDIKNNKDFVELLKSQKEGNNK